MVRQVLCDFMSNGSLTTLLPLRISDPSCWTAVTSTTRTAALKLEQPKSRTQPKTRRDLKSPMILALNLSLTVTTKLRPTEVTARGRTRVAPDLGQPWVPTRTAKRRKVKTDRAESLKMLPSKKSTPSRTGCSGNQRFAIFLLVRIVLKKLQN